MDSNSTINSSSTLNESTEVPNNRTTIEENTSEEKDTLNMEEDVQNQVIKDTPDNNACPVEIYKAVDESGSIEEEQKARTELRKRFIKMMCAFKGKQCEFTTVECTTVTGEFQVCDSQFENICVENLETPARYKIENALLRACDLVSFSANFNPDTII